MTTAGELADCIATAAYMDGQVEGLARAARLLRDQSGNLFKRGEDKRAHTYRDIAERLEELAREAQQEYDTKYRKENDRAFDLIDKHFTTKIEEGDDE